MKVVTVIGARPQFIKSAPVSKAFLDSGIQEITVHTGQHYDDNMSAVFFEEMRLPEPSYRLTSGGLSRAEMIEKIQSELVPILQKESPNFVLVYGDTNSTLAGARAAKSLDMSLVHVEAGLRSFNLEMPEEHNRIETDQLSDILFTPTEEAVRNLQKEGFDTKNYQIHTIGDVMYDALLTFQARALWHESLGQESFFDRDFGLATVHRFENVSDPNKLRVLVEELNAIHENEIPLWMPLHPSTAKRLKEFKIDLNIHLGPPVGYLQMLWLLQKCKIVLTDSGGLQKEAYFSKKPCVTLRDQTEWVELVDRGVNKLHQIGRSNLVHSIQELLDATLDFSWKGYGEGNAAEKISATLLGR